MRWLNPAAFIGLLGLAVPILVHLFGRREARRQRFPTLRLLRKAQPTPATRSRPSDVLLLMLRCAVVLAAVLGLSQPRWSNAERSRAARVPVRAIIVDTGSSMLRLTSDGSTALQRARLRSLQMLDSAREAMVIETDQPGVNVAGAASWLVGRSGLRELVIISDFQAGSVAEGHLASVLPGIGIRLERERVPASAATRETRAVFGDPPAVTLDAQANHTTATWSTPLLDTTLSVVVLSGAEDTGAVRASLAAVRATTRLLRVSGRRVAVIFPRYSARREFAERATLMDSVWHGDLLIALRRDKVLAAAAEAAIVTPACDARGVIIARNVRGDVVATMVKSPPGAQHGVLVFACVEPGSLAGTALVAGTITALDPVPAMQELEPQFVPDETLRQWERPPTEVAPRAPEETSPDGRWFWVVAILLLLVEEWLRRRSPRKALSETTEVPRERVA